MPAADTGNRSPDHAAFPSNPFRSLRYREFRYVWSTEVLHLWATEIENIALAWFVLSETGSPAQVGLLGATRFAGALFSPLFGAVVDRFDRRRIQIFSRAVSTGFAGVMLALVVSGQFEVWHAFVIVAASSLARMMGIVVNQALSADAVPAGQLSNAMGLNRATIDGSRIAGSLLGGSLMAVMGLGAAYVAVVSIYFLASAVAFGVSINPRLHAQRRVGYVKEISDGLRYVRDHRMVAGLLFFAFLIELTAFPVVNELMTVIGAGLYSADAGTVGVMRAVASAGALAGALAAGASGGLKHPARLLLLAVIGWHLMTLPLATAPPYLTMLAMLFAWGVFGGVAFVALMVGLLQEAPAVFRGRVMGLRALAIYGLPLGLVTGGWLAESYGAAVMLWAHGLGGLALTLAGAAVWPVLWRPLAAPGGRDESEEAH